MHHARIGRAGQTFGKYLRHIVIGIAGVDDQRQARFLGGLNMDAQRGFLHLGAGGGIVVIQPCLANADHFGVLGKADQFGQCGKGFRRGRHGMCACRIID